MQVLSVGGGTNLEQVAVQDERLSVFGEASVESRGAPQKPSYQITGSQPEALESIRVAVEALPQRVERMLLAKFKMVAIPSEQIIELNQQPIPDYSPAFLSQALKSDCSRILGATCLGLVSVHRA